MKYLAIDYGLSHIGLAVSDGLLAEPYSQLEYKNDEQLLTEIFKIISKENIEIIILGLSEGEMAEKTMVFGEKIKSSFNITVEYYDETLSSEEAKDYLIQAEAPLKKRQQKQHQTAAAIILQNYLNDLQLS